MVKSPSLLSFRAWDWRVCSDGQVARSHLEMGKAAVGGGGCRRWPGTQVGGLGRARCACFPGPPDGGEGNQTPTEGVGWAAPLPFTQLRSGPQTTPLETKEPPCGSVLRPYRQATWRPPAVSPSAHLRVRLGEPFWELTELCSGKSQKDVATQREKRKGNNSPGSVLCGLAQPRLPLPVPLGPAPPPEGSDGWQRPAAAAPGSGHCVTSAQSLHLSEPRVSQL